MSTVGWLFNFIPWWLPYVIAAVALVATMPYWGPLWNALPTKLKTVLIALGAGIGLWWMGRNQGAKSERDQLKKREAGAVKQKEQINADVHNATDDDLDRRLDRWRKP